MNISREQIRAIGDRFGATHEEHAGLALLVGTERRVYWRMLEFGILVGSLAVRETCGVLKVLSQREGQESETGLNLLQIEDLLSASIDRLDIRQRTKNAIKNVRIFTIQDLVNLTEAELLRKKDIGKGMVAEIKKALASLDLSLATRLLQP